METNDPCFYINTDWNYTDDEKQIMDSARVPHNKTLRQLLHIWSVVWSADVKP